MECNTTKKFTDYTDEIMKEFPYLSKHDIEIIVRYGWRQIYFLNQRGGDTILNSHKYKYWLYIGELTKNPIKHFRYYRRKMQNKLRVMYTRKKIQWDGYYYVALTNEEYEELLESFNKKGRKKKYYTFNNKKVFKILDECKLAFSGSPCIIKFKGLVDLGFSYKKEVLKCEYPEIAFTRDRNAKFEDILVSNDNYEYL